jgi:hypothetical protein
MVQKNRFSGHTFYAVPLSFWSLFLKGRHKKCDLRLNHAEIENDFFHNVFSNLQISSLTPSISGDVSTDQALLMTGAAVGAIAGVIRTAVDRRWGVQKDTITKVP